MKNPTLGSATIKRIDVYSMTFKFVPVIFGRNCPFSTFSEQCDQFCLK